VIVGIDLGTSTSEIAILKNGRPQIIREVLGSSRGVLPSIVGLTTRGRIGVGDIALSSGFAVQEIKRKMGSGERVQLGAESYTPQEISAFILRHLKEQAEQYLGQDVTEAVITVPAYFTDAQRRATEDAGEIAGLTVRRLIAEPTAAALAYGIERLGVEELVVVYDLGGGTLDVTLLELSEGVLDVVASTGNNQLGGKNFDEKLMSFVATECRRQTNVELTTPRLKLRLKDRCKKAKEALSQSDSTTIVLENIGITSNQEPIDFEFEITRETFEGLIREMVLGTRKQLDEALQHRGTRPGDVQTVLLIGGSTRIPLVRQFVSEYFGGRVLPTEVSPDEAVCLGAAVLGGIIDGTIDPGKIVLTDVTPFTLGVAVVQKIDGEPVSGMFSPLIKKQSTIPRTVRKRYSTHIDWQEGIIVEVFQGDSPYCRDNEPVTSFPHEMKPAPAGAAIDIEFSYDLSGLVQISAIDVQTGHTTKVGVRPAKLLMSESEKRDARRRFERQWQSGSGPVGASTGMPAGPVLSPLPPSEPWRSGPLFARVKALIAHAEKERDRSADGPRDRISRALEDIISAVRAGDAAKVDRAERELTDLLFDLS
jgi:molecular chaperone DnaK